MGDKLIMSRKERLSKTILDCVQRKEISQAEAARRLNISYRQVKRRYKRFLAEGDAGLVHKSRGKPSAQQYPQEFRLKALELYETHYPDFGPTLAAEKMLEENNHPVNPETLRIWLKQAGIWQGRRKRKQHRQRRARRERFGELLQLDGSIHPWFEGNPEKQCLMNLVDDATGITESFLDTGETTYAAFKVLEQWMTKYGIPKAVYVDLKSLYVSPNALKDDKEESVEADWLTHFSLACRRLGIEVIKAYSPQAKGRVERKHAVYQDRFIKELKLKGITTLDEANKLLQQGFNDKLNQKFAKAPSNSEDAHIPLLPENHLNQVLCWDTTRTVKNDWTVQLNNQHYQLEKKQPVSIVPRQKITVKRHLDNTVTLWARNVALAFHAIAAPEQAAIKPKTKPAYTAEQRRLNSIKNKHKSPWSQHNSYWLRKDKTTPYVR